MGISYEDLRPLPLHVIDPGKFAREFIHSVPDHDGQMEPLMMRTIIMEMMICTWLWNNKIWEAWPPSPPPPCAASPPRRSSQKLGLSPPRFWSWQWWLEWWWWYCGNHHDEYQDDDDQHHQLDDDHFQLKNEVPLSRLMIMVIMTIMIMIIIMIMIMMMMTMIFIECQPIRPHWAGRWGEGPTSGERGTA